MKRLLLAAAILAAALPAAAETLAIRAGRVFPVSGPPIEDGLVLVRDPKGEDVAENLQALCVSCHRTKTRLVWLSTKPQFRSQTSSPYEEFLSRVHQTVQKGKTWTYPSNRQHGTDMLGAGESNDGRGLYQPASASVATKPVPSLKTPVGVSKYQSRAKKVRTRASFMAPAEPCEPRTQPKRIRLSKYFSVNR